MPNDTPRPQREVVFDVNSLLVGGAVALVGLAVLAAFLWMVPNAAHREVVHACEGLRPVQPNPDAQCQQGDEQCERSKTLAEFLCKPGQPCKFPMPAPDFTAYDYRGKAVHLSDFRGKVVLLNFWASWCGVCKSEKPQLNAMAGDLSGDDFAVVALASDRSWSDVLLAIVDALTPNVKMPDGQDVPISQALATYQQALPDGVPFHVYLDKPAGDANIGQIAASWGIHAVPDSALIDRHGVIRAYFVNKRDWQSDVAETCLRSLIDEK